MPDELWEGPAGEAFREIYLADQEGLPQLQLTLMPLVYSPKTSTKSCKDQDIKGDDDTSFVKMQADLWRALSAS